MKTLSTWIRGAVLLLRTVLRYNAELSYSAIPERSR